MHTFPEKVFRAYDVRGLVDKDFNEESVLRFGKSCGTYFQKHGIKDCVVGYDCRKSSLPYHEALVKGLTATGVTVISIGMVPTPILYFAVKHLKRQAGVMITASHNPSAYNGFKVWCGESTIHSTEIMRLAEIMRAGEFSEGAGLHSYHDIVPSYLDAVCERISMGPRKLQLVLDGGNGAGGLICGTLLKRLGVDVTELFCEPDGDFPNHHPDPVVAENMQTLIQTVVSQKADCGIGLDGDADRIGVVDNAGRLLYGDELVSIYAREILARRPGEVIIGDVKCSHLLFKDIAKHGGKPEMWITGHSMIKSRMKEVQAALAGEMSGHMFFEDRWFGFDDALYSAARLVEILSQKEAASLTTLPGWPKSYSTPEINIPCADQYKFAVVKKAQEFFRKKYDVIEIDGARLTFADGWGLVRASNTQPALVLRFEAESEQRLKEIREIMEPSIMQWIQEAQ